MFQHIFKDLEVRRKYSSRRIFNSKLDVWKCSKTRRSRLIYYEKINLLAMCVEQILVTFRLFAEVCIFGCMPNLLKWSKCPNLAKWPYAKRVYSLFVITHKILLE